MNGPEAGQKERRVERVQFETDRHRIIGDVTLPPEGYQSRFSDSLNRPDVTFIPVVNAEVSSIMGGDIERYPFLVVSKDHVRVAFPLPRG
jgi:2C-methyl-D-erythritol 2,4-cyclodiphosphate synthase